MQPPRSRNPCTNSGRFVALRRSYRNRVHFQSLFSDLYTRAPLMVQKYASDASRHTPGETRGRSKRWGLDSTFPCAQKLTFLIGLPSGSCNIETPGASEHCSPPGRNHRSSRTHFGLDAGWRSDGVYYESCGCGHTLPRGFPLYRVVWCIDLPTSYSRLLKAFIISILVM